MSLSSQLAQHLKAVHYGGNWTDVNLKTALQDVSWQQSVVKLDNLNTIASLVFHINYFIAATLRVLQGQELNAHDKYSFDVPTIENEKDWQHLLQKLWSDADAFIDAVDKLTDEQLWQTFVQEKYGSYFKNIQGIIEHTHYHLGQIVIIKKLLNSNHVGI